MGLHKRNSGDTFIGVMEDKENNPANKPLTKKQEVFVAAYTNPQSKGYLNQTESARIVTPGAKPEYAAMRGHAMMRHENVQNAVKRRLEDQGFGLDGRLKTLAEIGKGEMLVDKEVVTKNGQVVVIQVKPSVKERLNAIEVANKMDGTYAQQQLDMDIARDEAAALRKRILRDVTPGK